MPEQHQQATDVEKLVGELEVGVDRLRSLYEQYFMGIEKLEPLVPRKDVDRRIHVLRKEQIRNTALRFRFQMILQRYNTYQTHWQRVCREIENGTYKRHVVRANKRFSPEREQPSTPPPPSKQPSAPPAPQAATPGAGGARPPSVRPAVPSPPKPVPQPLRASPAAPAAPGGFPQPGAALSAELASELAELEQEFGPIKGGPVRPVAPGAAPIGPAAANAGAPLGAPPKPAIAKPAAPPVVAPRAAAAAAAARPASPPFPGPRPQAAPPPKPATPAGAAAAPSPAPRPPGPALAASPPAAPKPVPVAPQAAARPAGAPAGDLSDQRVRALYNQYVDAKRRQNESTAAITYEGIAKSIRDSSAKLRERHGKSVDFEVAIRDGKAILKPVIK
ncbi:MAG: MXAN_5187 C-terminal domain-containing protein [Polyangiaceae bacterium]